MTLTVALTTPAKAGVTTSEFWLTLASLVGSGVAYFVNPKLGGSLHDFIVAAGPGVAALYVTARTYLKVILASAPVAPAPAVPALPSSVLA